MRTSHLTGLVVAALFAGILPSNLGCYVETEPPVVAEGYTPQYYDGYVVYYDAGGRPFYYVNGGVMWVPPTSPYYVGLVNHWHAYGPAYGRWYGRYGGRYRGYRRR
jgi:hypothetical protein